MEQGIAIGILLLVLGLSYFLYQHGFGVINAKSALYYAGTPRLGKNRNCIKANFNACNGWMKRVVRLSRYKQYRFTFTFHVTKGSVCVELYGKGKAPLAILTENRQSVVVSTEERNVYRVVTRFEKADGEYELRWDEAQ